MSWKDIIKEDDTINWLDRVTKEDFKNIIRGLEKEIYDKYKGDEVMRLLDRGVMNDESIILFMRINKRLDKIAENPTVEELIDFFF